MSKTFLCFLLFFSFSRYAFGQTETISNTNILEVTSSLFDVSVDGIMDEGEWDDAMQIPLAYETEPGNNLPASSQTIFFLKYDEENIYFAFKALDEDPEKIRAFITDRDNVRNNDRVGVYLDPFNTNASAYDFTINALGIQEDGIIIGGGGGYDSSWDALWESSGKINDEGFFVEVKLPFKSIRYPSSQSAQTWAISAWRKIPRSIEVETRSHPIYQDLNCHICQFNRVSGFENIPVNRNIEILPTYVGNKTDERISITDERLDGGKLTTSFGIDARIGITNNFILNGTYNPDFSQIEADAAQLNINNRFALRFPEQRPFFQEGAEIFDTPEEVVFTRTIADPVFGSKATGKFGKSELAILAAQDEINNLIFPSNDGSRNTSLDENTTSVFGRYKYNFNSALYIGILSTTRFSENYTNLVNGGDLYFRPIDPLSIELQYVHSETSYPSEIATQYGQPEHAFGGDALYFSSEYDTRQWQSEFSYLYRNDTFRADGGFIPQVDIRGFDYYMRRKLWADNGQNWFTQIQFTIGGSRYENTRDQKSESQIFGSITYEGPLQSEIEVAVSPVRASRFSGALYDLGPELETQFSLRPSRAIRLAFSFEASDQIDLANEQTGTEFEIEPSISLRLGKRLEMDYDYSYNYFERGTKYLFKAHIFESNIRYNFTARFFIRSIIQYQFTDRNPDLYQAEINPTENELFTQWLISYTLNPQSVLFLGYSDDYLGYETEVNTRIDLTQIDRTFFFKVGYVWRF